MVPDYGYWLLASIVFFPGKVWYHANGLVYKYMGPKSNGLVYK